MIPHAPLLDSIYLKPGELTVAERPALVSTVLGSCVAVTLFSPRLGVGAICHAMLPTGDRGDFKYVDGSLRHMLEHFEGLKIKRNEIAVKLFGGADMFEAVGQPPRSLTVGRQNVQVATETLRREGLHLAASDVGGRQGRKLLFYTHTGEVFLKRLDNQNQSLLG